MENITELYPESYSAQLDKKYKVWRIVFYVLLFGVAAACVILTAVTSTANASVMRNTVLALSGFGGCVLIYIGTFNVLGTKRLLAHAKLVSSGEREVCEGSFEISKMKFPIRNSIYVSKVTVRDGDNEYRLNINSERAGLLPSDGGRCRFYTVYGFITAFERCDDADI